MPVMKLDENIKTLKDEIDKMKTDINKLRAESNHMESEMYRMEGSLKMLVALKDSGLSELELPEKKEEGKEEVKDV